jgi:hypothetical protein
MDRFRNSHVSILWTLIGVNFPGIAFFLYFCSWNWAPPGQEGLNGGPGEGVVWMLLAFPFLAVCTLINFVFSRSILIHLFLYKNWRIFVLWIAIVAIWFAAFKYDAARQYHGRWISQDTSGVR